MSPTSSASLDALTQGPLRRIGYSEILRVLFHATIQRVTHTKAPNFEDPGDVAKTKRAAWLRTEYDTVMHRKEAIEHQLHAMGLAIPGHGHARFVVAYDHKRRRMAEWEAAQQRRLAAVAKLRAQALIDLVDLPRGAAKDYLRGLQITLGKV